MGDGKKGGNNHKKWRYSILGAPPIKVVAVPPTPILRRTILLWGCWAAPSPPPACKYGQLTTSAIIIIDEEPEAGEVDLGGLKVFLVRQAEGVVVLTEPRQQVAAEGRCPCLGDCNDMICRYIVYIIYRSSCLSRTTRLVGDIAIFQQYVLVI